MKKFVCFVSGLLLFGFSVFAKPVNSTTAMQMAENFYRSTTHNEVNTIALVYTAKSSKGTALYYAYNVNSGFVIITADDAAYPVIGYSTERPFEIPAIGSTIGTWLKKRGEEVSYIQEKNIAASIQLSSKWSEILTAAAERQNYSTQATVAPLVTTTWNQSPYYNALCPGGSVTGCVATAMAQIMKYWNYPATGAGSSSYVSSYGTLSADYGNTSYNWSNMPNHISGPNNDVAVLNYQCGVSVEMEYSPSGSGAWVCSFDNPVCAENSYKNYFKYDPNIIQGLNRADYDDVAWLALMKNDLDLGRPIQYVGWDPNAGGHTWVCDGYDQNDFLHMNWGWGGQGNGYYFLNSMNPTGLNFSDGHEAVVGIVPVAATSIDASVPKVFNPNGFYCTTNFSPVVKLQNMGGTTLTSCDINYTIDNGSLQTQGWSGSLVTGQFASVSLPAITATPGSHTIVVSCSNPNTGADGNTANDQTTVVFHVATGGVLPVVEGFESGISSNDWALSSTGSGNNFAATSTAAATGSNCAMIDNMTNAAGSTSILETTSSYDLSSIAQPVLVFKMAYQQKSSGNNDKLQVFVSDDCGASWVSKWARNGSGLTTVSGTSSSAFVPTSSQFNTYTVNLTSVASRPNVIFRWKFFVDANGAGNDLYIDDINIVSAVATGIASIENEVGLELYPNPSTGAFHVGLDLSGSKTIGVSVTDMLGRVIESRPAHLYSAGENKFTFGDKSAYRSGIYFVNLDIDGKILSKKVVIN